MKLKSASRYAAAAVLALPLLLAACSRQVEIRPDAETQKPVVLLVKDKNGDYWNTVKMGAEAAAKDFGAKLTFDGPGDESDVAGQQALIRQYLAYGMDALILAPDDYAVLAEDVDNVVRKGVPVVAVESEVASERVSSFIGIDNYEAGRKAAAKLKELSGAKGRFVILSSAPGSRNAQQREKGIVDELSGSPRMQVADTLYCGSDVSLCGVRTREALSGGGRPDGILALNAAAAVGAAREIERMGLYGTVKLVAFENSPEELEWLQEGVIQATLIQNPFTIGYLSVKTALEAAGRQKVEKRIVTETRVIDSESMFWSDNQKMLFPFVQ
jgi:ribose transport system substrate-binding protein